MIWFEFQHIRSLNPRYIRQLFLEFQDVWSHIDFEIEKFQDVSSHIDCEIKKFQDVSSHIDFQNMEFQDVSNDINFLDMSSWAENTEK